MLRRPVRRPRWPRNGGSLLMERKTVAIANVRALAALAHQATTARRGQRADKSTRLMGGGTLDAADDRADTATTLRMGDRNRPRLMLRGPIGRRLTVGCPILAGAWELAARLAIERDADDELGTSSTSISNKGVNGSWRRAVLLALVRSEVASAVLTKASKPPLSHGGDAAEEAPRFLGNRQVPAN